MTASEKDLRVIIAVTEPTSILGLWRTAMEKLRGARADVLAVFVHDERWHRAASLPFTREVSRAGSVEDFTVQRANQIFTETVSALRDRIEELASEADLNIEFRALPESDEALTQIVVGPGKNLLIAPSLLAKRPLYAMLSRLDLQIELVEADEDDREAESADSDAQ